MFLLCLIHQPVYYFLLQLLSQLVIMYLFEKLFFNFSPISWKLQGGKDCICVGVSVISKIPDTCITCIKYLLDE